MVENAFFSITQEVGAGCLCEVKAKFSEIQASQAHIVREFVSNTKLNKINNQIIKKL